METTETLLIDTMELWAKSEIVRGVFDLVEKTKT